MCVCVRVFLSGSRSLNYALLKAKQDSHSQIEFFLMSYKILKVLFNFMNTKEKLVSRSFYPFFLRNVL